MVYPRDPVPVLLAICMVGRGAERLHKPAIHHKGLASFRNVLWHQLDVDNAAAPSLLDLTGNVI